MERPNHLHTAGQTNASRLTGLIIVIAIHVVAILGLITALASDRIRKELQDIKATVEAEKTPPKPPPPPPVDMVQPPPPSAIIPEFTTTVEAPPPPVTVVKAAPPPPKTTAVIPSDPLRPIARTHTLPPYPTISQRLGEHGTTAMVVNINIEGNVTECKVDKSSGSERLDTAACDYVKARWRWQPPTQQGVPHDATTRVSVVWDLKDAQ